MYTICAVRIVKNIAAIFSPIIFAQYFFSVLELCTLVFGLQLVSKHVCKCLQKKTKN